MSPLEAVDNASAHRVATADAAVVAAETGYLQREGRAALVGGLADLDPGARAALLLASEGFSGTEVATAIGRSEAATRTLLCRTRLRVRGNKLPVDGPGDAAGLGAEGHAIPARVADMEGVSGGAPIRRGLELGVHGDGSRGGRADAVLRWADLEAGDTSAGGRPGDRHQDRQPVLRHRDEWLRDGLGQYGRRLGSDRAGRRPPDGCGGPGHPLEVRGG